MEQATMTRVTLSPERAHDAVRKHAVFAPEADIFDAAQWTCVDGRYDHPAGYAGPGAAMGAVLAVYAGLESYAHEQALSLPDARRVYDVCKKCLGGRLSCHSDDHNLNHELRFAGCGHCAGALNAPERAGLATYAAELRRLIAAEEDAHLVRTILTGDHQEAAVFVLPLGVRMPGRSADHSAFVFHPEAWELLLAGLAHAVAAELQLAAEPLAHHVRTAGEAQLTATLAKLAVGLPTYKVDIQDARWRVLTN